MDLHLTHFYRFVYNKEKNNLKHRVKMMTYVDKYVSQNSSFVEVLKTQKLVSVFALNRHRDFIGHLFDRLISI